MKNCKMYKNTERNNKSIQLKQGLKQYNTPHIGINLFKNTIKVLYRNVFFVSFWNGVWYFPSINPECPHCIGIHIFKDFIHTL